MTTEFFDYMKRINDIRSSVMEKEVEKIFNTEDRYNDEYPDEDTKVVLTDKGLNNYKWKNLFPLHDYQNFFLDEIKGKKGLIILFGKIFMTNFKKIKISSKI